MNPLKWQAKEKARKAEIKRHEDLATAKAVCERFLPPPDKIRWDDKKYW